MCVTINLKARLIKLSSLIMGTKETIQKALCLYACHISVGYYVFPLAGLSVCLSAHPNGTPWSSG